MLSDECWLLWTECHEDSWFSLFESIVFESQCELNRKKECDTQFALINHICSICQFQKLLQKLIRHFDSVSLCEAETTLLFYVWKDHYIVSELTAFSLSFMLLLSVILSCEFIFVFIQDLFICSASSVSSSITFLIIVVFTFLLTAVLFSEDS